MVCYALLGKTRGKVSTATASENFRYTNSWRRGVKHPPLQPSSSLIQIDVLVCPDSDVQIALSKLITHRQRQWGFLAERALSYSCFNLLKEIYQESFLEFNNALSAISIICSINGSKLLREQTIICEKYSLKC